MLLQLLANLAASSIAIGKTNMFAFVLRRLISTK
jgi:hypothetical protein